MTEEHNDVNLEEKSPSQAKKIEKETHKTRDFLSKSLYISSVLVLLGYSYQAYTLYTLQEELSNQKTLNAATEHKIAVLQNTLLTIKNNPKQNIDLLANDLQALKNEAQNTHQQLQDVKEKEQSLEAKVYEQEKILAELKEFTHEKLKLLEQILPKKEELTPIPLTSTKLPNWLNDFLSEIDLNKSSSPSSK